MSDKRFLVYTSAGDKSSLRLWLEGRRNFDLWVTAYGNDLNRYKNYADYFEVRKGGKFQNLRKDWLSNREVFAHYDSVLVLDDDIIIDADGISRLFEVLEEYDLTILQPAFLPFGKVSHPVTRQVFGKKLRFVDFIEVTCPLFRRDSLEHFLNEYDGELLGWGIDYWFLDILRKEPEFLAAIIDSIPCVNPVDSVKGGQREISLLQPDSRRRNDWLDYKLRLDLEEADSKNYTSSINDSILSSFINFFWVSLHRRLLQKRYKSDLICY
ncbi:MAG: hypothetical protein VYA80_07670 [Pseudomonadota bacterium]|nr:hypothetical protein [Pseudomonadota bacterium]